MNEPSFRQYLLAGPLALIASKLAVRPLINKVQHPFLYEAVEIAIFLAVFLDRAEWAAVVEEDAAQRRRGSESRIITSGHMSDVVKISTKCRTDTCRRSNIRKRGTQNGLHNHD